MLQAGPLGQAGTRCRQLTFPLAGILTALKSEAPTPLEEYIACPARNATNEVTTEMTSATAVNAIALAA
jgi:hypothetical protein